MTAVAGRVTGSAAGRVAAWLHGPLPEARAAVLRLLVYAFVPLDVLVLRPATASHAVVDAAFYQPLLIGRLLALPTPGPALVQGCRWGAVVLAVAALVVCARGRSARLLGWALAAVYLQYQVIAFSYGKVDHDRFGFVLALAVVPTLGALPLRSPRRSEAAGWVLRTVQLAAVATYLYAAVAKIRFGGWGWVRSGTLTRAVVRRGTALARPLLDVPWALQATQWGIVAFELASPLVFAVDERWRRRIVTGWLAFHVATFAAITIIFLPHLVCLTAFLPLERLVGVGAVDAPAMRTIGPGQAVSRRAP